MVASSQSLDDLSSIDWDWREESTDQYNAQIHPYHAKYIPQIPQTLIQRCAPEEGGTVLDPFNGSGTTTMVAPIEGYDAIGFDLNPLACLVAEVKSHQYNSEELRDHSEQFLSTVETAVSELEDGDRDNVPLHIPPFPNQTSWYRASVRDKLGAILYQIKTVDDPHLQNFYKVCFSALTKRLSRSDEDWTYVGDNMLPDNPNNRLTPNNEDFAVFPEFEEVVEDNLDSIDEYVSEVGDDYEVSIHNKDSREITQVVEPNSIDFAVTSPPYPTAVDYARYHRLSFYWLGYPVTETKEDEIGARSKRGRKNVIDTYFEEMKTVYTQVYESLKPGCEFCIIVGNTQHKGEEIHVGSRTKDICEEIGFQKIDETTRGLHRQSMASKSITEEQIIRFIKPEEQ